MPSKILNSSSNSQRRNLAISARDVNKSYTILHQLKKAGSADGGLRNRISNSLPNREREIFHALREISFDVERGEVVGLIGRNGAGKSTLLKILSRITTPTTGEIEIYGRVGSLLEVGTGFHPDLTGRENIFLNGAILGMKRRGIERQFDAIVDFAGTEKFLDTPVKRYSSGMYVRLAFAVAAHLNPEVLIVDEVLAVGDQEFQNKCLGKMRDVVKEGARTIIFVSHNMAAVQALCNRCIMLQNGQITYDGEVAKGIIEYQASAHEFPERVPGEYDLTNRTNEHDNGKIVLRKVTLRNAAGEITNMIPMGDPMQVEIEVEGLDQHPGANLGFRVSSTSSGQLLGDFTLHMNPPQSWPERSNREVFTLRLPKFPFMQGRYSFGIAARGLKKYLDFVEPVGNIQVLEHDYYGTGYRFTEGHSIVLMDGSWDVTPAGSNHLLENTPALVTSAR